MLKLNFYMNLTYSLIWSMFGHEVIVVENELNYHCA